MIETRLAEIEAKCNEQGKAMFFEKFHGDLQMQGYTPSYSKEHLWAVLTNEKLIKALRKAMERSTNAKHTLEETGLSLDGNDLRVSIDDALDELTKINKEIEECLG